MTRLIATPRLVLTAAHEGRIVRKRDNHARRFRVCEVLPERVIFEDLQTGQVFPLFDYSTYELTPENAA
jgi:hypothetical protein